MLICLLAGGHVLLEGVPGLGKTTLLRTLARVLHLQYSRIQFTPDLMPADIVGSMIIETDDTRRQGAALPARADLRQPRAGRRDQPRHAEDAIGAARGDAGAHRDQRHHHARTGSAVPGDGHAEPDRNGRHVSAAGSAARPLPDEDPGALSLARGSEPHRRAHACARGGRASGAGDGPRRDSGAARRVPRGSGGAARAGFRHRPGDGDAAGNSPNRTAGHASTSATAVRRAARRRWWSAGGCWR